MNWSVFATGLAVSIGFFAQAQGTDYAPTMAKISSMNKASATLNAAVCGQSCDAPAIGSESCNKSNSYFENYLSSLLSGQVAPAMSKLVNSGPADMHLQSCIRASLDNCSGHHVACDAKGKIHKVGCECASRNLVTTVEASFRQAVDCLTPYLTGQDDAATQDLVKKNLFSLVAWESGFHMTSISGTSVLGVFQVQGSTVNGVNGLIWKEMMSSIKKSDRASCQLIDKINLQPADGNSKGRCSRISPEDGNPLQGLLNGIAYQKVIRDSIEKNLNAYNPSGKTAKTLAGLSPHFREQLVEAMSLWAHNTGLGGFTRPMLYFLSTPQAQHFLATEDLDGFMNALKGGVQSHHQDILPDCDKKPEGKEKLACQKQKQNRVHEVTGFYQNVRNNSRALNDSAGGAKGENKCGI